MAGPYAHYPNNMNGKNGGFPATSNGMYTDDFDQFDDNELFGAKHQSKNVPNFTAVDNYQGRALSQQYAVHFKITYETQPGESICVLGSIPELGTWKTYEHHLIWTVGNVWISPDPVMTKFPFFQYKYVLLDNEGQTFVKFESGVNRILDLRIATKATSQSLNVKKHAIDTQIAVNKGADALTLNQKQRVEQNFKNTEILKNSIPVETDDEWEVFYFKFGIFDSTNTKNENIKLSSNQPYIQDDVLRKSITPQKWMNFKYGQPVQPTELLIKINNTFKDYDGQIDEQFRVVYYSFDKGNMTAVPEREPRRMIKITNPDFYKGETGDKGVNEQGQDDEHFVVNNVLNKVDGNFLNGFFTQELAKQNLVVGPYPACQADVDKVAAQGCKAVVICQTPIEIQQRGVNKQSIEMMYKRAGIQTVVHNPLDDYHEQEYLRGLFEGTKILNDLINKKKLKTYLHCTSGITRSPTQALVYECLCIKDPNWKDSKKVAETIKMSHKQSFPNMVAANKCIMMNKKYQQEQFDLLNRKSNDGEADRLRRLQQQQQEADRARRDRIAELEAEKKRTQRYHDDEDRRLHALLKRCDDDEAERLRNLKAVVDENLSYEHFADGEVDIKQFTDQEFDDKCDELFNMRPIPFIPKKGDNYILEKEIERRIKLLSITIPIIHVKGHLYLIGVSKQIIQLKSDNLVVNVGGGYAQFEDYIPNNHKAFERTLLTYMIKSQESLEWVCDALIDDRKIPQNAALYHNQSSYANQMGSQNLRIERRLVAPRESNKTVISPNRFSNVRSSPTRDRLSATSPTRKSTLNVMSSPTRRTPTASSPARRSTLSKTMQSPGRSKSPTKSKGSPSLKSPMKKEPTGLELKYQKDREQIVGAIKHNQIKKMDNVKKIDTEIQKEIKLLGK